MTLADGRSCGWTRWCSPPGTWTPTPTGDELALAARAAAHGLRYLPPEQTTDTDLSVLAPGETVLVRAWGWPSST